MAIIDNYSETNVDGESAIGDFFRGAAQSFTGNGAAAAKCGFRIRKVGSPTGNAVAKIYAHSGTFGTSSIPTGSALATSNGVAASGISTTAGWVEFIFPTPPTLTNGTKYVVTMEFTGTASDLLFIGQDQSSPTHAGNASRSNSSGVWTANVNDFPFYVESASEVRPIFRHHYVNQGMQ